MDFLNQAHTFADMALDLFKKGEHDKAARYWNLAKEQLSFHLEGLNQND